MNDLPVRPLRALADVVLGRQRAPQHEQGPHLMPYLRAANVSDGRLNLDDVKEMNFTPGEQFVFALRPGDVLVTEGSGSLGTVGASAAWQGEIPGIVCFQNTLLRLRPKDGQTNPRFLAWWSRAIFADGVYASIASGANIFHLSAERVRALPFPCPPLDQQRRIAAFLDAETIRIDSLMHAQRQARAVLFERRTASVWAAVTGQDIAEQMPSKLAWADTLPAAWQSVKLGHFARMGSGHTPSRSHPEWWVDCSIPWITTGEVSQVRDDRQEILTETRERISEIGMANSSAELHPKGTVVLCRTASAGYSGVMGEDMATSQDFVTWACGRHLDPFYLLWCLRGMRSDLLGRLAMGSTHKTIYVPDLQALRIPLPPLAEQHRIVANIRANNKAIDAIIDTLDRQASLLAERRQALITAAVTGGITV